MSEEMLFEVDQHEIDWTPGTSPTLTGRINGKPWRASFVLGIDWMIFRQLNDGLTDEEIKVIKLYLTDQTPPFIQRILQGKTALCAVAILTLVGIGATAAVIAVIKRHHKT